MKKQSKDKKSPAKIDYVGLATKSVMISGAVAVAAILLGLAVFALGWIEMAIFTAIAIVAFGAVGVVLVLGLIVAFSATVTRNAARYTKKITAGILFAIKNIMIVLLAIAGVWLFIVAQQEPALKESNGLMGWLMIGYVVALVVVSMILRSYIEKKLSKYMTKEERLRQAEIAKRKAEESNRAQLEEEARQRAIEAEAAKRASSDTSGVLAICALIVAIIAIVSLLVSFCGWFIGTFGMVAFLLLLILILR